MKKVLLLMAAAMLLVLFRAGSQTLFYESFNSAYSSHFYSSCGSSNAGTNYTCAFNNGVGLINTISNNYMTTKTVYVASGYGVKISFYMTKASGYTASNVKMFFVVNKNTTFDWYNPTYNAWTEVKSFSPVFGCSSPNTVTLPAEVVGGQRLSITIQFKSTSSTNWVAIEDLKIEQVNYITPANSYNENFNSAKWYPDGSIAVPYHSYTSASSGYTYLWNYGKDGYGDYYAALYTGFDYVEGGASNFITKEINTSGYLNGELRFMWRSQYPCGGPTGYTSDEVYTSYAPKVWIIAGGFDGGSWTQLPVNYYFPDATWRYASYDISQYKNQSVKIKFERGGFCSNPVEGVDNVRVYDRNCLLSREVCGAITGPDKPGSNTEVHYSVSPVSGAVYYKWLVRSGGSLFSKPPYIVSGQGTTQVTVNFGSLSNPRILCIPYDADLSNASTDTTGVCYAKLAYRSITISSCTQVTIASHPQSLSKCTSQQSVFSVTVEGTSPSYRWQKNSSDISGATDSQFSIPSTQLTDAGTYTCIISNACSSATSNAAELAVNSAPAVTQQPVSLIVCSGGSGEFSADAEGAGGIAFQWYKNSGMISGATATKYTFTNARTEDAGTYLCVLTNTCGTASSSSAALTVDSRISISLQPVSLSRCLGQASSFSVTAAGGDIKYQWKKNTEDIAGATVSAFSILNCAFNDSAAYSCRLSNACGTTNSGEAKLKVIDTAIVIAQNPPRLTHKCEGEEVTLAVTVEGSQQLTYQWLKGNKNISGETKNVYLIDSLTKNDEDFYFCKIGNACKSITTDTVFIVVYTKPFVNSVPITVTKQVGETVKFSISPLGTPPFSYQWRKAGVNIPEATNNSYTINTVVPADEGFYSCSIINSCGTTVARIATLIVKGEVPGTYILAGSVSYDNKASTPMNFSTLYLKSNESNIVTDSCMTDSLGYYKFYNVANGNYRLYTTTPKRTGGIDPTDALIVNKIFLGSVQAADSLKYRACDVNADKKINPTDALLIIRRYLGVINTFKAGDWLFEDKLIVVIGSNVTWYYRGICFGDVNGSYVPPF